MATKEVLSVGIDVGTTTSQLVLSELSVSNQARMGLVPRLEIDSRTVVHQSEPWFTPLEAPDLVDVDRLLGLIRDEYTAAGVDPTTVDTGAVIITGETARTKNAEAILHGLSEVAGDFVVTVAGPNLESQIAGRGSGAAEWSASNYATVINVDIGGGSANAAVFRSGRHLASGAAMVGGRQCVLDPKTFKIIHMAPPGAAIVRHLGLPNLQVGDRPTLAELRALTDAMADVVVDLVFGIHSDLFRLAELSPPLPDNGPVGAYFISGGVGTLYYEGAPAETLADVARFGDVGPLFARSLRENPRMAGLKVVEPAHTLRATVLGAASQQVTLSGSTIWAEPGHLPMRNLPVIEPVLPPPGADEEQIEQALHQAIARWDRDGDELWTFAVSLDLPPKLDYDSLAAVAGGVARFCATGILEDRPIVLVIEQDYAQILGQTIKGRRPELPLVVVDQIGLGEGDFIDIGEPMFDGRVVPVSVKTLVFYQ